MKNERLKTLMAQRLSAGNTSPDQVQVLNKDQLLFATAGRGCDCPSLTSCGTFCSNNCGLKVKFEENESI